MTVAENLELGAYTQAARGAIGDAGRDDHHQPPPCAQCLHGATWETLHRFADEVRADPEVRVLMIHGAGEEAFTAGSDIREFAAMSLDLVDANFQVMEDAITAIETLPIPTLACLNGHALGGGLELALACDIRVASERATLGMPIARLGIMISPRFAKRLVDLVGPSRAKDLLYTGRMIGANEALAKGMVNYFVLSHELRRREADIARRIVGYSAPSVAAAKRAVALCLPLSGGEGQHGGLLYPPGRLSRGRGRVSGEAAPAVPAFETHRR